MNILERLQPSLKSPSTDYVHQTHHAFSITAYSLRGRTKINKSMTPPCTNKQSSCCGLHIFVVIDLEAAEQKSINQRFIYSIVC